MIAERLGGYCARGCAKEVREVYPSELDGLDRLLFSSQFIRNNREESNDLKEKHTVKQPKNKREKRGEVEREIFIL